MSSKSKFRERFSEKHLERVAKYDEKRKQNHKNHVTEKDLSPGGFPFHFAGPKKKEK